MISVNINNNLIVFYDMNSTLPIYDIEFVNGIIGYIATKREVFKSTDSGVSWYNIYSGPDNLHSLDFRDEDVGWIGGSSFMPGFEVIKSTSDGGSTWNLFGSYGLGTFYDISCINDSTGYAINDHYFCKTVAPRVMGAVYYFSDTYSLNKMFFINNLKGWIVSTGGWPHRGRIYFSNNGGNTWTEDSIDTQLPLNDIYFIDDNIGWTVGNTGTIFRTDSGSINYLEDNQINNSIVNFYLGQNYPNPFNPVTNIKYSLPYSDIVQIKVYDILGNEIEILVNEYKQTGTYEIEFNASNLPSGVYFYKIISGSYSKSKKMLLLR